jgi:hypothetical protein
MAQRGGTYAPVGGYKGSGMAIVLSLINSFLSGGLFDDERIRDGRPVPGAVTHWFAAYDVRQFVPAETFTSQVRAARDRVRANPPRAGVDRVLAPGDLENELARAHARAGIPYEQFTLDELGWVAEHTARRARLGRRAYRRPPSPARPRRRHNLAAPELGLARLSGSPSKLRVSPEPGAARFPGAARARVAAISGSDKADYI